MIRLFNSKVNVKILSLLTMLISAPLWAEENATFNKVCRSCHTGGFKGWISGAPNVNKKEAWKAFLERDSAEQMIKIVLEGTDDHKLKGGCSKCSDESIIKAVNYILSQVQ